MEIKKNSFGLLLTYATVMLFPSILFLIVKNNTLLFYATLCCSLLGVATMFYLNKKMPTKTTWKRKQRPFLEAYFGVLAVLLLPLSYSTFL